MFLHTRQLAQTGPTIPAPTIPLSNAVFDPKSPLYTSLSEDDRTKLYAESSARTFDGWTGASLERVSFKYWGFEREFGGNAALMAGGYDKVVDWLEAEIVQSGGEIRKGEKVVGVQIVDDDKGKPCPLFSGSI